MNGNAVNVNKFRKEEVLLVAPILAADKNSRARIVETAKDFPIVRLIATDNYSTRIGGVNHTVEPRPIYVEVSTLKVPSYAAMATAMTIYFDFIHAW